MGYITSDPADPLRSSAPEGLRVFWFRRLLPFVIQFLRAPALVMTTTDLHRFHLRRSVFPVNHVYLFHALVSTHMIYRFGAFDHYDTILCGGPHHVREIRRAEELYRLRPKRLLEAGYPHLDELADAHRRRLGRPREGKGTVLIAPSWGAANILESCEPRLTQALSGAGYRVIVRPHPEFCRRNPDRIAQLSKILASKGGVMDMDYGSEESLHAADLLITDWSGIAMEYAFATERPVLFLDVLRKVNNPRYEELGIPSLEAEIRERIGQVVSPVEVERIPGRAEQMLREGPDYRPRIVEERARRLFNAGSSAAACADFLLELRRPV